MSFADEIEKARKNKAQQKFSEWADSEPFTSKETSLLIDDMRDISVDFTARTYANGIDALQMKHWDILYLDHDLGEEKSGYDILVWLEQNPEHLPGKIKLVTANPVGRTKMQKLIHKLYTGHYY